MSPLEELFAKHTVALTKFTDQFGNEVTDFDRIIVNRPDLLQAIKDLMLDLVNDMHVEEQVWWPDDEAIDVRLIDKDELTEKIKEL